LFLAGDDQARAAFRRGAIPAVPPLLLDPVSRRDASLAPPGAATVTVTLSAIPHRLFDGGWTPEQRTALAARTLLRIEKSLPGTLATVASVRIVTPPDMENLLGVRGGDLDGGFLAPDQMLSLRPGARTPLPGFYLGGRSTQAGPLGTGAAGFAAAAALMADGVRGASGLPPSSLALGSAAWWRPPIWRAVASIRCC
jgi:phytoene dehydrogenase-like protein